YPGDARPTPLYQVIQFNGFIEAPAYCIGHILPSGEYREKYFRTGFKDSLVPSTDSVDWKNLSRRLFAKNPSVNIKGPRFTDTDFGL
ncbi:hypothetical protein N9Z27_03070, partial [Alphaproteobacteria bacterium]|nr:hypothetical protein [Alphaproteobacteria bacterium]